MKSYLRKQIEFNSKDKQKKIVNCFKSNQFSIKKVFAKGYAIPLNFIKYHTVQCYTTVVVFFTILNHATKAVVKLFIRH